MLAWDNIDTTPKGYFNMWREDCIPSMTLIAMLEEGNLYYYDGGRTGEIWVVVGKNSLIISYRWGDENDLSTIKSRVRLWHNALKKGEVPNGDVKLIGKPQYGAFRRFLIGKIKIVWFRSGDWMATVRKIPLPKNNDELPRGWSEDYRKEINRLRSERESNG